MCRIVGIVDKQSTSLEQDITSMRDAMMHGGPDGQGLFTDLSNKVALGHRRLSIIDLSPAGHQPMCDETQRLTLVFNGEIYNFQELKAQLLQKGHRFYSHSDTEVVLRSFQQWGVDCFSRFRGMFAIAVYDREKQKLTLARDHAGIKPLYCYADGSSIYFASEVRSFLQLAGRWHEDPLWKLYFLSYGFLPGERTTLAGVASLPKGVARVFDLVSFRAVDYPFFSDDYAEEIDSKAEAEELLRHTLDMAVKRHLVADAPLGVFLSGGIDSSLITILARKYKSRLRTLSVIFEEEAFSERAFQQIMIERFETRHDWCLLNREAFVAALPDIMLSMDQPTADGINTYFICRFARAHGLKAVLSGLGADELFGGYPSFRRAPLLRRLQRLPSALLGLAAGSTRDRLQKLAFLNLKGEVGPYLVNRGYFIPRETARILGTDEGEVKRVLQNASWPGTLAGLSDGNRTSHQETTIYMEKQLLKDTDFMSMWHGVEVRVPFLDMDLMRLVQHISSPLKFGGRMDKFLLVDSFSDVLPEAIWNRKKQGFVFPFQTWMQGSLDQYVRSEEDRKMQRRFRQGKLSWSRYWTYILSRTYQNLP